MADDQIATERPPEHGSKIGSGELDDTRLATILQSYKQEAEEHRKSGVGARDAVWDSNVKLYWGDFKDQHNGKVGWQSKEVLPEIPMFVDRWAASMREAINRVGEFFEVEVPGDKNNSVAPHIKKFIEYILSKSGRNQSNHPVDFSATFEEILKLSAMMTGTASVTWKQAKGEAGYVAIEAVDPRNVWFDAKGRGLYRIRNFEMDKHELVALAKQKDKGGKDIWNVDQIKQLTAATDVDHAENKKTISGTDTETTISSRKTIQLDEYYCTVLDDEGEVLHVDALIVVANGQYIVRGPEKNPFAHGQDWIVSSPAITVPLSTYGKSYMENWSQIAVAFNEMTNLILDGVFTSTMNAFGVIPEALSDATQLDEGVWPNKVYKFEEGTKISDVFTEIKLGKLPPESLQVWQGLKAELREGAAFNELSLGQVPPKGDITATEINASQQGSAVTTRSIARTIETGLVAPILNLAFMTGLQHLSKEDEGAKLYMGEDTFNMLLSRKQEFLDKKIVVTVGGISALIERSEKLKAFLRTIEIISQQELLLKHFTQKYDMGKVLDELTRLTGIDLTRIVPTERERQVAQIAQRDQQKNEALRDSQANQSSPAEAANQLTSEIFSSVISNSGN